MSAARRFDITPRRKCGNPGCGKTFDVRYEAPNQLYCNRKCNTAAQAAREAVVREDRICALEGCGTTFNCPVASERKHCSDGCRHKARYRGLVKAKGGKLKRMRCCRCQESGHFAKTCKQPKPDRARVW